MKEKRLLVRGYPIASEKYGDKDAVVTLLTEKGPITIRVTGGYLPGGRYHQAALMFNLVECELAENSGGRYSVRAVTTLKNNVAIYEDLPRSSALNFEREILLKMFTADDEYPYELFGRTIDLLGAKFDPLTAALVFLAQSLTLIGTCPEVNCCNRCGTTKNLVHFSMEEGGFVCGSCARETGLNPLSPLYLKTMRYIFKVTPERLGEATLPHGVALQCFKDLCDFVLCEFSLSLKTADFLLNCL